MTWLLQERVGSLPVIVIGIIAVVILGVAWAKTGRMAALYGLGAVVILCGLILALQRFVKTEAEQVEATLAAIARDVERNDVNAIVAHVHSRAAQIRAQVENEFPNYKFKEVKITRIREIKVEPDRTPPRAIAQFSVVVTGTDAAGFLDGQTSVPRYVVVTFHKENGQWRVWEYEHFDPQQAIMK